MQSKRNSLLSNLSHNALLTLVSMLSPLLIISFVSKSLGVENYGIYATIISYSFIYIVFTELGLLMTLTRRVALVKEDKNEIDALIQSFLFLRLATILLVTPLFIYCFYTYVSKNTYLLLLSYVYFVAMVLNFSWFFQGAEIVKVFSKGVFVSKIVLIILVILSLAYNASIAYYIFAQCLSTILLLVFSLNRITKLGFNVVGKPDIKNVKSVLKESLGFYFARLTVNAYESCSTFLVSRFLTVFETAQYAMTIQIFRAGGAAIGAISMSLYPYINRTKNYKLLEKITVCVSLTLVVFFPCIDYIYPGLVDAVFGVGYQETTEVIKLFFIGSIFQVSASFLGYPFFSSINKTYIAHKTAISGAISYFIIFFCFYFTNYITIKTMVVCIVTSLAITSVTRLFMYLVYKKRSFNKLSANSTCCSK